MEPKASASHHFCMHSARRETLAGAVRCTIMHHCSSGLATCAHVLLLASVCQGGDDGWS